MFQVALYWKKLGLGPATLKGVLTADRFAAWEHTYYHAESQPVTLSCEVVDEEIDQTPTSVVDWPSGPLKRGMRRIVLHLLTGLRLVEES